MVAALAEALRLSIALRLFTLVSRHAFLFRRTFEAIRDNVVSETFVMNVLNMHEQAEAAIADVLQN